MMKNIALSVSISHILYSGNAFAKKYELNFIGKSADKGVSIKDTITQDNQYDFAVKVDNPDLPEGNGLEVRIGNVTAAQSGAYAIGDYKVTIDGKTQMEHPAGLAFFGLSVEGKDSRVSVDNFTLNNTFLVGSKYNHNNTALYAGSGSNIDLNGGVYIRSIIEHTEDGKEATVANNGLYARGVGSTITANGGNVYINTYASNFKELLENNMGYPSGSSKSDAVSAKDGGTVNINQSGKNQVNIFGNLDFGEKMYPNTSQMNITLNGADSYWHGHEANVLDDGWLAAV